MFFHAHLSAGVVLERDETAQSPTTLGTLLRDGRDAWRDAQARRVTRAGMRNERSEAAPCG